MQRELHANNYWVQTFKTARDVIASDGRHDELAIIINEDARPPGEHARRYNKPITNDVAVIMPGDTRGNNRDIVLKFRSGELQRINELNHSYDPLQYPILFPHGNFGYNINMRNNEGNKLNIMPYYAYQLMDRGDINYILSAGRLTQQYIVDQYCKMETQRLNYIFFNQKKLRADNYQNFQDQMLANDHDADAIGQKIILPATYTGGPRYMFEKQADAMARVRKFGKPALLLTMTTSPAWE